MKLSYAERVNMGTAIVEAMQKQQEAEGEVAGDYDDARRYYREDAQDGEISYDYRKWVLKKE